MSKLLTIFSFLILFSFGLCAQSFVPENCSVLDWCVKNSTGCFVANYSKMPSAYYRAHAQYSVLRKATAICRLRRAYGDFYYERLEFLSPVEPVNFSGEAYSSKLEAAAAVIELCNRNRENWIAIAPKCESED